MGLGQRLQLILQIEIPLTAKAPEQSDRLQRGALQLSQDHASNRSDTGSRADEQEVSGRIIPQVKGAGRSFEFRSRSFPQAEEVIRARSILDQIKDQEEPVQLAWRRGDGIGPRHGAGLPLLRHLERDELAGLER